MDNHDNYFRLNTNLNKNITNHWILTNLMLMVADNDQLTPGGKGHFYSNDGFINYQTNGSFNLVYLWVPWIITSSQRLRVDYKVGTVCMTLHVGMCSQICLLRTWVLHPVLWFNVNRWGIKHQLNTEIVIFSE